MPLSALLGVAGNPGRPLTCTPMASVSASVAFSLYVSTDECVLIKGHVKTHTGRMVDSPA